MITSRRLPESAGFLRISVRRVRPYFVAGEDSFDVFGVQGFVFQQRLCERLVLLRVTLEDGLRPLVTVAENLLDLVINLGM